MRSARRKCNVARGTGRRMPTVWFGCMRSCVCTYGIVSRRTMCRVTGANSHTSCTYYCIVHHTRAVQCTTTSPSYPPRCQGRSSALRWPSRRCRLARRLATAPTTTTMVNSTSMQHTSPTTNRHHHHHHHQPTARLTLSPPRGSTLQKALPRHAPPQAQRQDGRPAWTEQPSTAAPAAGPSQPARRT